jgi:hypothetical protein
MGIKSYKRFQLNEITEVIEKISFKSWNFYELRWKMRIIIRFSLLEFSIHTPKTIKIRQKYQISLSKYLKNVTFYSKILQYIELQHDDH